MGTRCLLRLKRRKHADVYLWAHWDGYFDATGATLCRQLQRLLDKYSLQYICELVESLPVAYKGEPTALGEAHSFDFELLANVLEASVSAEAMAAVNPKNLPLVVRNDPCSDWQYEYILDPYAGVLSGVKGTYEPTLLSYEQIKCGDDFYTHSDAVGMEGEKNKIMDVCRTRLSSAAFEKHCGEIEAAIDDTIESEGGYCLFSWSEDMWIEMLAADGIDVLRPVADAIAKTKKKWWA